jgi:hypothetical protein
MDVKFVLCLLVCGVLSAQSAYIVDQPGSVSDVYASSAYKVYVDTLGNNSDLALRLCGAGQRYVSAVYSANVGGTYYYTTLSWNLTSGSTDTLTYTSVSDGGGCYRTPTDAYGFSQFRDFGRTPIVFVSAFPGRIHAMYSNSINGASPSFVGVPTANGWLQGSYDTTRTFNQSTGNVTINVTAINFQTDVGPLSRAPSAFEWGLNSSTGRSMVIGLCSDDFGNTCSDASIINSSTQLPVQLGLGSPTNDQVVYNRYAVVDGLGYPICIGADVSASVSAVPSAVYDGQVSNVTITLVNNGNVNITTDFLLALNITGPSGYTNNTQWTITETLVPGANTTRNLSWTVDGPSGSYTLTARADRTNLLAECNKSNNNATTSVTSMPVYTLHVKIDGNETYDFPQWGRPYNVTMWVTDSDNNTVTDVRYRMTETNGLNPFTPTQVWSGQGLKSYSIGEMTGNSSGYIDIAMIPTCNLLYTTYSYLGVDAYVGNYSITVNAFDSGSSPYIFAYNGSMTYDVPLNVNDYTCADPGWVNDKEINNKNQYVLWVYDWLYEVYSITKKLVTP